MNAPRYLQSNEEHWNDTNGMWRFSPSGKEQEKPLNCIIYDLISEEVGMSRGTPSDLWLNSLEAWLQVRGYASREGAAWASPPVQAR